jgi:two-component system response regulator MtrA
VDARILVVEDDEALGAQVVGHLEREGFVVTWIRDGLEARDVDLTGLSLAIVDIMLPGGWGTELVRLYRTRGDLPILMLSARQGTEDKVNALSLGADDYMTKPFWPEELVARVRARLRRPRIEEGARRQVGALILDLEAGEASLAGERLALTPSEHALLAALAARAGSAITRQALMQAALDPERRATERALDVHVSRLRKKLGEGHVKIATVWGIGYRLDVVDP